MSKQINLDELEAELLAVRGSVDDFDRTKFGDLAWLLDGMATGLDRALSILEKLQKEGDET